LSDSDIEYLKKAIIEVYKQKVEIMCLE